MAFLQKLWKFLSGWREDLRARFTKYLVTREVIKVLSNTHAQELAITPRNEWALVRQKQIEEIRAVREGQTFDIVDRRSWAYPYLPEALHRLNQPVLKNCFSADTEILTQRGWVRLSDAKKSDMYASRRSDGRFLWLAAKKIFKYEYKGEMLNLTGRRLDYLVTPDHRMLGRVVKWASPMQRKDLGKSTIHGHVGFMFAQDVENLTGIGNGSPFQVPLTSYWKGIEPKHSTIVIQQQLVNDVGRPSNSYTIPLMQWAAFLGIYLAEGSHAGAFEHVEKDPIKDPRPLYVQSMAAAADNASYEMKQGRGVHIAQQKHNDSYEQVKALMETLPFNYNYHAGGFRITSAALWEAVHPLGDVYNKHIPVWVKNLPVKYLEELVKWFCIGDGSKSGNTCGTASKQLADDLQEIYQKLGKWATIVTTKPKPLKNGRTTAPFYTVVIGTTAFGGVTLQEKVKYDGYVYCPAIPETGTVFVRRNGKAGWCGQTPYNLRRFSETPIPRRAMNLVKNSVLSFKWQIKPTKEFVDDDNPDREKRIKIATDTLLRPNNAGESFRDWLEQVVEDFLLNGAGCAEHRATPYFKRPTKFWAVDSSTIRIFLDWTESTPDRPRYAQMTGLKGERGIVTFLSDELMYIRDNIRTSTPFGLGRLEVGFNSINAFLGVQDMSSRAGSDQIHKTWLWWEQTLNTAHVQQIRRHVQNEIEGQAKLSLIAGVKKPDVIDVTPVRIEDLLLEWQKFLVVIIAAAFDLSPQALNMDDHPNRSTAQVMAVSDWRNAVVPVATRMQTAITRQWLHDDLGWKDLEFEFQNLDDPDPVIRIAVDQKLYMMDSITSDEIRKKNDMPPLPGPWGQLTMMQKQLLIMEAQAKIMGKVAGGMGGGGGMSGGMGGGGMGGGGGTGMSGGGGMGRGAIGPPGGSIGSTGMQFSAMDIAGMDPSMVQLYQELGILPDNSQLPQQMESAQPGILEQISQELREYFQQEKVDEETEEVLPDPVTKADEDMQQQKFFEDQHQETLAEKTINRRGVFGPSVNEQVTKNPERGKFPRSGGRYVDPNQDRVNADLPIKTGKPKRNYDPGQGNKYK